VNGLLAKAARDQRRGLVGWGIGVTTVVLMYAAFYPSIRESTAELQSYVDKLPEAIRTIVGEDYATAAGYLHSELFSSMGVILMLIFAIGAAARATAGEEENRTLDILLSTPLHRRTVLRDKALAIVAGAALLAAVLFVTVAVLGPPFDLRVDLGGLAAACVMLALLALSFAAIALAAGAFTGRRVVANAVAGGLAVFFMIVNALAPSVDALQPLRPLSPFRWYLEPEPLRSGLSLPGVAVLAGIAIAGYAIAQIAFRRRDLAA
jgi:ABC-2 type transport system permease protein